MIFKMSQLYHIPRLRETCASLWSRQIYVKPISVFPQYIGYLIFYSCVSKWNTVVCVGRLFDTGYCCGSGYTQSLAYYCKLHSSWFHDNDYRIKQNGRWSLKIYQRSFSVFQCVCLKLPQSFNNEDRNKIESFPLRDQNPNTIKQAWSSKRSTSSACGSYQQICVWIIHLLFPWFSIWVEYSFK